MHRSDSAGARRLNITFINFTAVNTTNFSTLFREINTKHTINLVLTAIFLSQETALPLSSMDYHHRGADPPGLWHQLPAEYSSFPFKLDSIGGGKEEAAVGSTHPSLQAARHYQDQQQRRNFKVRSHFANISYVSSRGDIYNT